MTQADSNSLPLLGITWREKTMLFVAGFQSLPIIYRTLNYVKMRPL